MNHPEDQKIITFNASYWDSVANSKVFATPIPESSLLALVSKKAPVLDYGCGYGRALQHLSELGYCNLYGIETSRAMADRARATLGSQAQIYHSSSAQSPFADDSFAAVLLFAVLTSITDPKAEQIVLSDIFRILKPGGYLFVIDNCIAPFRADRYRFFEDEHGKYALFEVSTKDATMKHNTPQRLSHCLEKFQKIAWSEQHWLSMNGNPDSGIVGVVQKPNRCRIGAAE